MKNIQTLLYLVLVVSLLNISAIIFHSQAKVSSSPVAFPAEHRPPYPVTSDVLFPETLSFATETVPLHRIDVQEAMKKELIVNTYLHSHTIQILKNAPRIFAVIEPILQENGIPDDFKYLAVIESNLNNAAVSPAGAVGLWQFIKGTAQELGLEINTEVDERYHLEKSTQAAAQFLKKAYQKFGSWTMAAAAYNAGNAMINKQMGIQQENNYYDLLLGEETGRYVFRILALKQIMNHPEEYNFQVTIRYPQEDIRKVKVSTSVEDWATFAKQQGITYKTLKRFNPWLRKSSLKNPHRKTYEIWIPIRKELYQ